MLYVKPLRESLKRKFEMPLPSFVEDINTEACRKICEAHFAELCRAGDKKAMRNLIIGLWFFVDEFPQMLHRGCWKLIFRLDLILKYGFYDVMSLLGRGRKILQEIKLDEESHRKLWLMTGKALYLKYPDDFYKAGILPAVQKWIDKVDEGADPFTMFMKFTSIEIIAECISKNLLGSDVFINILGKQGTRWFKAHVHSDEHSKMTHEELALHLGFALHPTLPTYGDCNNTIQEVVDLFIEAAESSVAMD